MLRAFRVPSHLDGRSSRVQALYHVRSILALVYVRLLTVGQVHLQRYTEPSAELLLRDVEHPQRNGPPKKVRTVRTLHRRKHQCGVDTAGCNRG